MMIAPFRCIHAYPSLAEIATFDEDCAAAHENRTPIVDMMPRFKVQDETKVVLSLIGAL